ncbi:MAG: hypothetical protein AAF571_03430 [Verrucomicrobiota bacterium]
MSGRGSRALVANGGNDCVMTPPDLARKIVKHFRPRGAVLEPCRGDGAFTQALPRCFWCEIREGKDFMEWQDPVDWIITNPPYSKLLDFLKHSMTVADNVVFLCAVNALFFKARQNAIEEAGFGIVEILRVPTPSAPWPQSGFGIGAVWMMRNWTGAIHLSGSHILKDANHRDLNE